MMRLSLDEQYYLPVRHVERHSASLDSGMSASRRVTNRKLTECTVAMVLLLSSTAFDQAIAANGVSQPLPKEERIRGLLVIHAAARQHFAWSDDLERQFAPVEAQPFFSFRPAPEDMLLVRYGRCDSASEEQFAKLIASTQDRWPRALILDLRDNPGGDTPHRLLGHLLGQPTKLWQRRTRCSISEHDAQLQLTKKSGALATGVSEAIQRAIERGDLPRGYSPGWLLSTGVLPPEPIHYDGPLYVLVNGETGSAAEDVAAILQGCGRATLVGTATAGSTGNTIQFDLPGGGGVRICAVQVKYADGRDFVPTGVHPDVPVARTIDGIVQGRDEVLQAALDRVQHDLRTRGAGK